MGRNSRKRQRKPPESLEKVSPFVQKEAEKADRTAVDDSGCQLQTGRVSHFFILGAISSTIVTRKYTPYSNQVIVLLQGKLFSGWFNANIINTIATISMITPIILDILFSCKAPPRQTECYHVLYNNDFSN